MPAVADSQDMHENTPQGHDTVEYPVAVGLK